MTYKFHIDPGHGWLEVPMAELEELGIADHISSCSYRYGDTAYLEEDCDFATFLAAKVDGYTPNDYRAAFKRLDRISARVRAWDKSNTVDVHHDARGAPECFIRRLPNYYH
jgi:hypothetical protein